MGWMTEESGVDSLRGARECCFLQSVQTGSDAHTASNLMGTGGASSVVEHPERKADHSSLSVPRLTMGGVILLHISSWLAQ
jgi:hypothetical protein